MTPLTTRRHLLTAATAFAAGAWLAPRIAIGRAGPPANSRINLAFIGVGGRGAHNLQGLSGENIVALCDVDDQNAAGSFDAHPKAKRFRDFREMLDKMGREIDAVVVSTPDHTHFAATMAAMELGKHVFCEKPLAHTVWEARTMKKAAQHYKIVSQMGNQGHATLGIRYVKEWYESGVLGQVTEVTAWLHAINFNGRFFRKPDAFPPAGMPVPAYLDWDLWLGPCDGKVPYNPVYHPKTWRGFYEFGSGLLGDWSCHTLDAPFWALELGMPSVVELENSVGGSSGFAPDASTVRYEFPARGDKPPVVLHWHEGLPKPELRKEWGLEKIGDAGMIMTGDKASLMTGERPDSPRLIPNGKWLEFRKNLPPETIPRIQGGHYREWTDAIRGDGPQPGSHFGYGADLTEVALLGVLVQRFGGRLEYDAAAMRITNRPELNAHLRLPARDGWKYGESLW
jgi:predicted dehydrogenase